MKRIILVALLLTPLSPYATGRDPLRSVVPDAASCPAGTAATGGPSYIWGDGRFVFDGYICEDLYRGATVGG